MADSRQARCKQCGATDGFYRNVTLSGTGWVHADVWAFDDGGVEGETDGRIEDKDVEIDFEDEWGCSGCGTQRAKLSDLIELDRGDLTSTLQPGEVVYDQRQLRGVVEKVEGALVWLRGFPVPYPVDHLSRATYGTRELIVFDD